MLSPRHRFAAAIVAASAVLVVSCHTTEPREPVVGLTQPIDPPKTPDLGRGAPRAETQPAYRIILGDDIGGLCAGPAPYFAFKSAQAKTQSEPTMQNLAACMLDGPLKGKSIVLVGHTDPRGGDQLNEKLGQRRADDVRRYLIDQGIAPDRVKAETAGKRDASADPTQWRTDRRVEVDLDTSK